MIRTRMRMRGSEMLVFQNTFHTIVCIGASAPLSKTAPPSFYLAKLPSALNLQTVQAHPF